MGKSAPKPPPAPDPSVIAAGQTNSNDNTALFQSTLNNTNQNTPYGTVNYNLSPNGQWTENVGFSPQEQGLFNAQTANEQTALDLGNYQLGNVGNALKRGLTPPSLITSGPGQGPLASSYDSGGQIAYGFNPGGPIQSQVAPTYSPFTAGLGYQTTPQGTGQPAGAQPPSQSYSPSNPPPGMKYDQSSGWIPSTPDGVDTTGAHPNEMYDPSKGWVPATSQAVYPSQPQSPTGAPAPTASGAAVPAQTGAGGMGMSPQLAAIASNPVLGTQLATYGEATQALDPQWNQAAEQQQAQLVAQGLNPNDAAYQNSMTLFNQAKNNAYDQALYNAIGAGNTEQNTLFGQNLNAGQFANQSQAQQYGENQGLAQFNNAAQAQANSQAAQAAAFNNAAYGQSYGEQLQNDQFANQAMQQNFQNQAYSQELPINEFNALMSSGQVQAPSSAPAQTSVAPTNVLGAYQLQQNALQNNYAAQLQNYSSGLGGLFNLGAAALKTFMPA